MEEQLIFDYTRLKLRAKKMFGTLSEFAKAMGWSYQSMSKHWNSEIMFRQDDSIKAANLLDIPLEQIPYYFFRLT